MTTADDFTRALAANPADAHLRLLFADFLAEGDPLAACLYRVQTEPDNDEWRLQYAAEVEPSDPARAELARVQVELKQVRDESGFTTKLEDDLSAREAALLAAHGDRWRRAGPCAACGGSGTRLAGVGLADAYPKACEVCRSSGDCGKLLEMTHGRFGNVTGSTWKHPVTYVRGMKCVTVPTLAECVKEERDASCPSCFGARRVAASEGDR